MSIYFFDASAIVKRYVREPGSAWVRDLCNAPDENQNTLHIVGIAEISRVEVAAAFEILVRRNEISKTLGNHVYDQFTDEFVHEYESVRLTSEIVRDAAELTQRHPLKAYDAVQLATALDFRASLRANQKDLIFVCGDTNLLQAARAEGLAVENPFDHAESNLPQ